MIQDALPLPYGTLGYYQIHYIVDTGEADTEHLLAKCKPITKGRFSEKKVVAIRWIGQEEFAQRLQDDLQLTELLKQVLLHEGEIKVDPLDGHVRIYGKWNHEENLLANPVMIEVADRIAAHIKTMIR